MSRSKRVVEVCYAIKQTISNNQQTGLASTPTIQTIALLHIARAAHCTSFSCHCGVLWHLVEAMYLKTFMNGASVACDFRTVAYILMEITLALALTFFENKN